MKHICPVCGCDHLHEPAYDDEGGGSYEFCPSCGFQFGYHDNGEDVDDSTIFHQRWRQQWIEGGMVWWSPSRQPPESWSPLAQLLRIGIRI